MLNNLIGITEINTLPNYNEVNVFLKDIFPLSVQDKNKMATVPKIETPFIPLVIEIYQGILKGLLLTSNNKKYAKESASGYGFLIRWLYKYEITGAGKICLEYIHISWVEEFSNFLLSNRLATNTVIHMRSIIKAILNRLHKRGLSTFNGSGIWAMGEKLNKECYNTLDEILDMANLDLSETSDLKKIRDIYIMQCFLGIRYSKFKKKLPKINKYIKTHKDKIYFEIKKREYCRYPGDHRRYRTIIPIFMPVARIVKEIIDRNNGDFKTSFSCRYYNKSIKKIAEKAGINNDVTISRAQGGTVVKKVYPKYRLMNNHTADRTFFRNAPILIIPYSYLPIEDAIAIADNPFFNISLQRVV